MKRILLAVLIVVALQAGFMTMSRSNAASANKSATRPNIILILADDLGYGDLACYGNQHIQTPNLDALARAGTRFTNYHTASAVCSPTRASILTGLYPLRFGITKHFEDGEEHLPSSAVTLPELLREAGYTTAHVGKWHLGGLNKKHIADRAHSIPGPLQHGFDHYLACNEEPEPRARLGRARQLYRQGAQFLFRDDRSEPPRREHLTEVETAEAEALLERFSSQARPFYLQTWFLNPHTPYEPAPDQYLKPYASTATGDELLYRSMVAQLDASVGRLMTKLRQLNLADNTLILFSSDNGPTGPGSTGGYRGGKGTLFEGGLRVPLLAVWPGRVRAGVVSDEFALSTDLLPTVCAAAGVRLPQRMQHDGQNLWPHLRAGQPVKRRAPVFWQMRAYPGFQRERKEDAPYATEAVRRGRWKLLVHDGQLQWLFDLQADPREQRNLLEEQPRIAAALARDLKAWLHAARPAPTQISNATSRPMVEFKH